MSLADNKKQVPSSLINQMQELQASIERSQKEIVALKNGCVGAVKDAVNIMNQLLNDPDQKIDASNASEFWSDFLKLVAKINTGREYEELAPQLLQDGLAPRMSRDDVGRLAYYMCDGTLVFNTKPSFPLVNSAYAVAKHIGYFGMRALGLNAPFQYREVQNWVQYWLGASTLQDLAIAPQWPVIGGMLSNGYSARGQ